MKSLGVDWRKAAKIHESCPDVVEGKKDFGGYRPHMWGPLNATALTRIDAWPWHEFAKDFKVVIDTKSDLAFEEFGDAPLVRLEFFAKPAWV